MAAVAFRHVRVGAFRSMSGVSCLIIRLSQTKRAFALVGCALLLRSCLNRQGLYSQSTPVTDIQRFARAVTDRRQPREMERNDALFP